jgi:hypothetical protein
VGHELALGDQAVKRLFDEVLSLAEVVEDLAPEGEEATVHPEVEVGHRADAVHPPARVGRDHVKRLPGTNRDEARDRAVLLEF